MNQAPWFEDFKVGDDLSDLSDVPSVTLTPGMTALHQAVFGDRSRLCLDQPLCKAVTGRDALLVNPALVCNLAIGQSTIPSQRVMGNLFYRGLRLLAPVFVGDTLTTSTRVVALRQNSAKPGRDASGMVALEITTLNQQGDEVLHFWRCPMIPCKDPQADTGHKDDFGFMPESIDPLSILKSCIKGWQLDNTTQNVERIVRQEYETGQVIHVEARDTVTSAPEMVRMTLNMAMTHTDVSRSVYDKRLVYGGHTIALAASQLSRVMPDLACILAWYKCDHLAPVFEGDILQSQVTVGDFLPLDRRLVKLNLQVSALRGEQWDEAVKVLDWDLLALLF